MKAAASGPSAVLAAPFTLLAHPKPIPFHGRLKSARARAIFLAMAAKADGSTDEVTRWPQRIEREMIVKLLNPLTGTTAAAPAPGFAIKFGRTPASYDRPASVPGAHSEEILARFANLSAHKRSN